MELGFLRRLREDPLWERLGWIYGTSAGALSGVMAVRDRLDELEEFVLELRPDETFRPNRLWQLPLTGLHDYALPETIAERLVPIEKLAEEAAAAPIELVVCVTDVRDGDLDEHHAFERDLLEPLDAAGGDGAGRAGLGGDQRARPAAPGRAT